MKKILSMAFLAVLLLSVFAVADPFKVSVKGNKKFLEFTSREGLFYKVPLNPQNSKFVYKEVTIKPGDYFIVSTTKPENPKGFAHVFRFDSLDPAKKILHLTDLATGTRQVTYEHEGTDYIGYIVAGGFSYAFSVDPKFNKLDVDLNGDGALNVNDRVFVSVLDNNGYIDLETLKFHAFDKPVQSTKEVQELPDVNCGGLCFNTFLKENTRRVLVCNGKDYEVDLLVLSETSETVKLRINGEITEELAAGDKITIADGSTLIIENIDINNDKVFFSLECLPKKSSSEVFVKETFNCGGLCFNTFLKENTRRVLVCNGKDYEVELLVLSETSETVKLRINGEITEELAAGDKITIADGSTLIIENIDINNDKVFFSLECLPKKSSSEVFVKKPFNSLIDFDFVVGDQAPGSDVVAVLDILNDLGMTKTDSGVTSIKQGAAKIASEVEEIRNVLSVGNPCDNPITEKITGISDCHMNLEPGQGFIGFYQNNGYRQIVVAGYSPLETRIAARAFKEAVNLKGNFFIVEGERLDDYRLREMNGLQNKIVQPEPVSGTVSFESSNDLTPPNFPQEKTITLQLRKGWNLVSLPGKLVKFLENDCVKKPVGFVYLKDEKKYVSLKDAARLLKDKFSTYLAENAFWIYSYDDCEQDVIVEDYEKTIVLESGWNLIPNIELSCSFLKRYWWNPVKQEWQTNKLDWKYSGTIVKASEYCEEKQ